MAYPDRVTGLPLVIADLNKEFKKITGEHLDVQKVMDNDLEYLDKYSKELDEASNKANRSLNEFSSTKNKIEGRASMHDRSYGYQQYKESSLMLLGHMQREAITIKQHWQNFMKNKSEDVTRAESAQILAGTIFRMAAYRPLMVATDGVLAVTAYYAFASLFGDDEDKEDVGKMMEDQIGKFTMEDMLVKNIINTSIGVAMGSRGNYSRDLVNWGVEMLNYNYGEGYIWDGGYDFGSRLVYTKMPVNHKNFNKWSMSKGVAETLFLKQYSFPMNAIRTGRVSTLAATTGIFPHFYADFNTIDKVMKSGLGEDATFFNEAFNLSIWDINNENEKDISSGFESRIDKKNPKYEKAMERARKTKERYSGKIDKARERIKKRRNN